MCDLKHESINQLAGIDVIVCNDVPARLPLGVLVNRPLDIGDTWE